MLQTSVEIVNPGGTGSLARRHFRQPGALAAEHVLHLSVAVGGSVAERVDILLHVLAPMLHMVMIGNNFRKIRDGGKLRQ